MWSGSTGPLPRVELQRAVAIVLSNERDEVPAKQLLLGVPHESCRRRIDEGESPFEITVIDDVGGLLGELPVARLAFSKRFGGTPAFGDVVTVDDDAADARVVETVHADTFDVPP